MKKWGGLKVRTDGTPIVKSKLHVQLAEERIEFLAEQIELQVKPLREELDALDAAVDAYVLKNFQAGDGYEDDKVKLTKVVGHRRVWNPEKLQKLLPTKLYKLVIDVKVNKDKLDALVKEGKIDVTKIEAAYEETPNTPYVKKTIKGDSANKSAQEAGALASALG